MSPRGSYAEAAAAAAAAAEEEGREEEEEREVEAASDAPQPHKQLEGGVVSHAAITVGRP